MFDYIFKFLVLVGVYKTISPFLTWLNFMWRCFIRSHYQSQDEVYNKYGTLKGGSWAVVTGGSDGIGLAICQ